jgi:beta-lactamase regulating signal transducer with metallopeptidase domain
MIMNNEFFRLGEGMLAAVLNGIYQGVLIALLVWLGLRLFRRTNAATRHAVWFCTLLMVVSLIVGHVIRDLHAELASVGPDATTLNTDVSIPLPELSVFQASIVADTGDSFVITSDNEIQEGEIGTSAEVAESRVPGVPTPNDWSNVTTSEPVPAAPPGFWQNLKQIGARLLVPISWKLTIDGGVGRFITMGVMACWIAVAGFRLLALLVRLHEIRMLKRNSLPPDESSNVIFEQLLKLSGMKRRVRLRMSPTIVSPVLLGFLNPVILLSEQDTPEELKQVLRHELAHVGRRDDWANLFQQLIQAVLFFHPAVWWISKRLTLDREIACDDHVLQQGSNARAYALLLANLAGRMREAATLAQLAPGVSTKTSQLKQRIDMLLDTTRNRSPRLAGMKLGFVASSAAALTIAALCAGPRIVLAQSETAPVAAESSEATTVRSGGAVAFASTAPVATISGASTVQAENPSGVDSGPKWKSGASSGDPGTVDPVAPVPPTPPRAAIATAAPRAPHAPHPVRAGSAESSLEERLDRLEQAVQQLLKANRQPGATHFEFKGLDAQPNPSFNWKMDRQEFERNKELAKNLAEMEKQKKRMTTDMMKGIPDEKAIKELTEQAQREGARAAEEARKATREIEKAMADQKRSMHDRVKDSTRMQLDALRRQLENLDREKERLRRQIERIEKSHNETGDESDNADDDASSDDAVEVTPAPNAK